MKKDWIIIIFIATVLVGLTGSVFLTIWLWGVLPRWLFFLLIGSGITSNGFLFWKFIKK